MSYHYGKFVWFEHFSPDTEKARAFYEQLFGWQAPGEPMGDQVYPMITNNGAGIGGFRTGAPGVPSHWFAYLSVADVDATAEAIKAAGGTVITPPTDYPPVGRGCTFSDPQGARLSAWHSSGGDREDTEQPVMYDWCWNELMSTAAEAAVAFYTQVFGYDVDTVPMAGIGPGGSMGNYFVLKRDGIPRGGIMQAPQEGMPSFWTPYVTVPDCDACAAKAAQLGAKMILPPTDIPDVGRIAMLEDPGGAFLGFMRGV